MIHRRAFTALSLALLTALTVAPALAAPLSKELMADIHEGWGPNLKHLQKQLDTDKDYVTWIIEAPTRPMDLRSAELFRRSMVPIYNLSSSFKRDGSISHMMVAWQCHDENGKLMRGVTGMTGENSGQSKSMFLGGWGQSAFLAVYNDGELNVPEDLEEVIEQSKKESLALGHITFEVSRENCTNMLTYLRRFIDHPNKPMTRFGVHMEPLRFEGGGCGTFATALLHEAGIMKSLRPKLWRTVKASTYLMGAKQKMPVDTELELPREIEESGRYIFFNYLSVMPWSVEDGPDLKALDPELGLFAFQTIAKMYSRDLKKAARGLITSAYEPRVIHSMRPNATTDLFDYIQINAENDPQAAEIAHRARVEMRALIGQGMKMKPTRAGDFFGLLIEK